jgi:hypothetical protein
VPRPSRQANGAPGARCVLLPDGHDSLCVGGRELGRGLGDAASGVPATAQCRWRDEALAPGPSNPAARALWTMLADQELTLTGA